jgi:Fe2+ or Zn2+ uptake regulation protein
MDAQTIRRLEQHGIRASAQRAAIAQWVLATDTHPSADEVWTAVRKTLPMVSRATVYNTLKLFVEKGLLRELVLAPGCIVYDPKMEPHHHFIEDDVREFSVVLHGRRRGGRRR